MTVIALPAIWLFTRSDTSADSGASTADAIAVAPGSPSPTSVASSDDEPFGTDGPIFVDGPTTPPKPAVIQIVVPAEEGDGHVDGGATYKRSIGDRVNTCSALNAPYGALLTVTNRDNGRFTTCVNRAPQPLPKGVEIMLTVEDFGKIAQLVDAPVPVRITWQATE